MKETNTYVAGDPGDQIQKEFFKAFGGVPNFFTPVIVEYGRIGPFLIELSTMRAGDSCLGETLFGVTVLHDGKPRTRLSQARSSEERARDYIASLGSFAEEEG